jgi:N-methylhydantoinase B
MEFIYNNVRYTDAMRVDCQAMIATTQFAERRAHAILSRYGRDQVLACIEQMIQRTERAVRAEIASIPDGTYTGEAATDDDGTVLDEPVWVRADVTIAGDELEIDLSRSDSQRPGFVNRVWAATYGAVVGATILTMDPALADYHNEGSLRPIKLIAPEGSVTNAQYPATVGGGPVAVGTQIIEAVTEALSKARPERAVAAWGKHRGDYTSAVDPRTGRGYVRTTFDYDGSAGAFWGFDGPTGPTAIGTLGSVMRGNVEDAEVRFPWRIVQLEIVPDFMGAGRWRAGCGVDWRAINEGSAGRMATGSSDGDEMVPKGVLGGNPAPKCRTFLRRGGELIRVKPHRMQDLQPGDELIKLSSGGGGVGSPFERDPAAVLEDVTNGLVSPEGAEFVYGVAVEAGTMALDAARTADLRAQAPPSIEVAVNEAELTVELRRVESG